MRTVTLYIATSLDGYIAGPNGEIDWLFTDQDYGYSEFIAGVDTLIMGRKTYEVVASFLEWLYAGQACYVLSSNPERQDPRVTFTNVRPADLVDRLRQEEGRGIWIVGGGRIISELADAGMIDEYVIAIHPVLLGHGIPLWTDSISQRTLKSKSVKRFDSGLVMLTYSAI
jgi:dihydrofolate reductase